jgi:membrane-associated protease RseP (regulator of RpoE activity)
MMAGTAGSKRRNRSWGYWRSAVLLAVFCSLQVGSGTAWGVTYLGVSIKEVTNELAKQCAYKKATGAYVTEVIPGSPAEKAGLQAGDIILSFAGKTVRNYKDLPPLVAATPVRRVSISVFQQRRQRYLTATLVDRDAESETVISWDTGTNPAVNVFDTPVPAATHGNTYQGNPCVSSSSDFYQGINEKIACFERLGKACQAGDQAACSALNQADAAAERGIRRMDSEMKSKAIQQKMQNSQDAARERQKLYKKTWVGPDGIERGYKPD